MLAPYWRLRLVNKTDQTLSYSFGARANIRMRPWGIVSGVLAYGSSIIDDMGFTTGSISVNGESEGDIQDNTSNKYWGINGFFEVVADLSSTDGTVYLYLEESDNGTTWPSDASDFDIEKHMRSPIAALDLSTTAADRYASVNFVIN